MKNKILPCVVGLGYVGLPVFLKLNKYFQTVGYDTNQNRVASLNKFIDTNKEFSKQELKLKNGSKLINAVSNSEVPHLTLMIGSSYGAGNYGMNGRSYNPRFLFTYPNAKSGVMGSEQLAGVMEIIKIQSAK